MEDVPKPEALTEEQLINSWLAIGRRNPWIKFAVDPPFTRDSFHKCEDLEELQEKLVQGNWCNGQGFYHKDLCFIEQGEASDEFLTIKGNIAFESISWHRINSSHGPERVRLYLDRLLSLIPEQCNLGWSEGL